MTHCEVVEVRNVADADGFACSRNALTVAVSCANPTRKPVADATRSSARPALNGRSSTSRDATRRDFFHASMTRGSQ